jgi:4-deoxy-L-threo-5-hexosulose-uronate ketol-isomerase
MDVLYQHSQAETATMNTEALRSNFLIQALIQNDQLKMVYTHYDRVIVGGAAPTEKEILLPVYPGLKANYFLERRELGIINVGGEGEIVAEQKTYS